MIKTSLGFNEFVEGESSSQGEARNSNEKSEILNKEQPRKENPLLLTMEEIDDYFLH